MPDGAGDQLTTQSLVAPSATPSPSLSTQTSGETHVQAQLRESISYSVCGSECQRVTIRSGAAATAFTDRLKLPLLDAPLTAIMIFTRRLPSRRLANCFV